MSVTGEQQRVFVVSLVAMPGCNPVLALRGLLKIALRRFKLRCISVSEENHGSHSNHQA